MDNPLLKIKEEIRGCTACPLHELENRTPVPPDDTGRFIMIIGEAPGREENSHGKPFIGASGKSLSQLLSLAGLARSDCYITNVAKCWPDSNKIGKQKAPTKKQQQTCGDLFLKREVDLIKPGIILTLGATALKYFLPHDSITDVHGQLLEIDGVPLVAMYHPAAAMYNPQLNQTLADDFKRLPDLINRFTEGEYKQDIPSEIVQVEDFLELFSDVNGTVAVDFETTDLRTHVADVVGIAVAWDDKAYYIPTTEEDHVWVMRKLQPLWDYPDLVAHNAKYEMGIIRNYGIKLKAPLEDTLIQAALLNKPQKGLKPLALQEFGYKMTEISELIGSGKKQINMREVAVEKAAPYACADVFFTRKLFGVFSRDIPSDVDRIYRGIEKKLLPAVVSMEQQGCKLDSDAIDNARTELDVLYNKELIEFQTAALIEHSVVVDDDFNPISPKQSLDFMHQVGANKLDSTNANVMQVIASQFPIANRIVQLRHLRKLKGTYIEALYRMQGRAYGSVNPTGTDTGRFSYSGWKINGQQWGINLQTIPKPKIWEDESNAESNLVRQCFIPDDGKVFIELDYSQIELRVMAHMSDDQMMIDAYMRGADIHTEMQRMAKLEDYMPNAESDSVRRVAKIMNFALQYDPNDRNAAFVLQRTCAQAGVFLSNEQADDLVAAKRAAQPGLSTYYEKIKNEIRSRGYVETFLGRRLRLNWIEGYGWRVHKSNVELWRTGINMPIQGTSADMMKMAIIKLFNEMPDHTDLIWTVHDSVLLQTPIGNEQGIAERARTLMAGVLQLNVPVEVDYKVGYNLADMH